MKYFSKYSTTFLIAILLLAYFIKVNGFFDDKKSEIIRSDGLGYYSYLPAMFIYGDYSQQFVAEKISKYYKDPVTPDYMESINGKPVDKYFFGTAVMMYPFFMTAHLISFFRKYEGDGYSLIYQYFIGLSALFYIILGIYFCDRLLRSYGAKPLQALFICILILFATNLIYYSAFESSMSHAYSFCTISAFLLFSRKIFENNKNYILPACIALGLIILIRPINLLIIFSLPFLAGSFKNFIEGIKFLFRHYMPLIIGAVAIIFILLLQCLIWYKQTGHFIVYSYNNEKFYFDHPHMIDVLFSYRKGIFIYTPLCFISLAGFYFLFRENRFASVALLLFFTVLIYIFSCWHQWFYGGSFGFRPLIEYFPLVGILLFYIIRNLKNSIVRISFAGICVFLLYLNNVQAYQYKNFILHWDQMSRFKYWKVFLKTDHQWSGYVWDNPEPEFMPGNEVSAFKTDFETDSNEWIDGKRIDVSTKAYSGTKISLLDSNFLYSTTLLLHSESNLSGCSKPSMIVTGYLLSIRNADPEKLQLVVSLHDVDGKPYYYRTRPVDYLSKDKDGWMKFELGMVMNKIQTNRDAVKVYFFNTDKKTYWIDDVSVRFINLN